MIRNTKTERVHRAIAKYIRPKLRPGADVEFTPAFAGIDDDNVMQHISHIAAAAMRLTVNQLAFDASPHELHKKMREAAVEPDGTKSGVDDDIVTKVLLALEHLLLPSELLAVRQILTAKSKRKSDYDPASLTAEDARLALDSYTKRFPDAAKIRVEPTCAPAPQRHAASSASDYFKRFPSAQRIGF
ncbi:hypothetical protein IYW40_04660 [Methylocystis sp. H4A]|uniref:hypothetical protein n=1 Tax=Methylocystis sp. H4A TaxID=2785788 RepID=UPI0018C21B49|nr:hypothetical protein [Methylocystis sp. H4A]MBG0800785.1 hypothetical protein [Methylocystis sp. H4A]